jgi:lipopolysaccharide export system permease LptF/LptG-like protein
MIPGRTLHRLAVLICSANTVERVVEPAIADLQKEYAGADRASSRVRALLTGYIAILKVMAICAASVPSIQDERCALWRTLAWSVGWIVAISALLTLPPLVTHSMQRWDAAMAVVPQALPLAIPMGIAFGIAFGLSARPATNITRLTLLGGVAASALSFVVLAWAMPAANQAFREITFRELTAKGYQDDSGLQKGHNEMTLSELRREEASFAADGEPRQARQFAFAFHLRFALAVGTLALASLLLATPFNHRGLRGLIAFAACFLYLLLLYTGEALAVSGKALPPVAAAWLPNLALVASAIVIASSRSSRLRGSFTSEP